MNEFQKTVKINTMKQLCDEMTSEANMAIQWLDLVEPDTDESLKSFMKWNQKQGKFWYYLFQMFMIEKGGD